MTLCSSFLFLQKRVRVLQPGASELPGGKAVKTCFPGFGIQSANYYMREFQIPEEEHGHLNQGRGSRDTTSNAGKK